ncbi:MAG: hypothetical protein Q4A39_06210, partial [Eubacteriales bacterium]|nr:hypothetical protein [Eubacteriales bacterium]
LALRRGIYTVGITQNKRTVFERKLSFYFGLRPDAAGLAPFDHLTAEMNSAYGNSPLCSELTRDSARPPPGICRVWPVSREGEQKSAHDPVVPIPFICYHA